ncbi:deoxyuridine 5'-triphosphate nucleotidohydrolase-like [Pleurodeles waltl]|uniref:deoxyuridine 5'-triphosphate nucleotidohydrolase-like n=1 Tax=Pleurodeles waltl TaxID=8319 RepID=UPI0037098171
MYWKIKPGALAPYGATPESSGLDLHALKEYTLKPRDMALCDTCAGIQITLEHFCLIAPRSGLALGEIKIILRNGGNTDLMMQAGDRIAQMLIIPVYGRIVKKGTVPTLLTVRGERGFSSTDKNLGAQEKGTGDDPVAAVDPEDSEDVEAEDEDEDNRTSVIQYYFR